ncbi:elongation of very long chain fatty acids protein AAEL008004-like [Anoplophora glabripennis]|uniref:elongation of very long chain fatty acids protein AAEL008004-like n=1 Tax=Anoplophora glabripennis TaxID=217634 RepID=UPI0008753858|nr:elongation of very long chain fatty acids protein AAEL008004-like [Anoplophora glabripennis]
MALVLKRMYTGYFWLFDEIADTRVQDYGLLSSPLIPVGILTMYVYFVLSMGPRLMKDKEPFQLKSILALYNFSQIVFNLLMLFMGCQALSHMNLNCNVIDYTLSSKGKEFIRLTYFYYLLKLFDLLDTILIVLRKNTRQVTFLHVYHHCAVALGSFIAAKFMPGGELFWTGFLNVIVHSVMYFYYLMSTLDSKWKTYLTVKKVLTQLQLVQFAANILIYGRLLFKTDCHFPSLVPIFYVPQNMFMIALFGDFYVKTYILNNPERIKGK